MSDNLWGVLIGGLLASGTAYITQRLAWRQEREARAEERADERRGRRADFQIRTLKSLRANLARYIDDFNDFETKMCRAIENENFRFSRHIDPPRIRVARSQSRVLSLVPCVEDAQAKALARDVITQVLAARDVLASWAAARQLDDEKRDQLYKVIADAGAEAQVRIGELLRAYHADEPPPPAPARAATADAEPARE